MLAAAVSNCGCARRQNRRVLAEIEQHTRDARLAGFEAQVAAALAPTLARERYLGSMIDAPDKRARWRACVDAAPLPLGWRLRKFMTFSFPDQVSWIKIAAGGGGHRSRWCGRVKTGRGAIQWTGLRPQITAMNTAAITRPMMKPLIRSAADRRDQHHVVGHARVLPTRTGAR
jgi:hypothetical protein